MKVLHILRNTPDEMTRVLIEKSHTGSQAVLFPLFEEDRDYDQLVKNVFEADRVISWW